MTVETLDRRRRVRSGLRGTDLCQGGKGEFQKYNEFEIEEEEKKSLHFIFIASGP